jgi:signal peptidase II
MPSSLRSLGLWTAALTFLLDQATKLWMIFIFKIPQKQQVAVTPFMDFVFVINKGISYGLLSGVVGPYVLSGFSVVVAAGLIWWLSTGVDNRVLAVSVGLLIGGALGNAIDRLWAGGVADFVLLHAFGYQWYVFNIADVAIVAGVVGLLYDSFVTSRAAKPS